MASKTSSQPSRAAAPVGPYTPVVRAGDWVIVSGQLGIDNGALVPGGVSAQTTQAVKNLKERLKEAGVTINDVAKTLCFLTDMDTFATFNAAYVESFGGARPARSTIGVAALPFGGAVEIEAWAYKPVRAESGKPASKTPGTKPAVKKAVAKKAAAKKSSPKPAAKKPVAKKSAPKPAAKKSGTKPAAKKSSPKPGTKAGARKVMTKKVTKASVRKKSQ
ncbi:MAG: Rid family hydrolase [Actinomycetota bacterium]